MTDPIDYAPRHLRPVPVSAPDHDDALEHAVARLAASAVAAVTPPAEPAQLTDVHYAANSLDALKHRDMAAMCKAVWGDEAPTSADELAHRIAGWADSNRSGREVQA